MSSMSVHGEIGNKGRSEADIYSVTLLNLLREKRQFFFFMQGRSMSESRGEGTRPACIGNGGVLTR